MKRNFNTWLSNFCDSISDYRYYVDFNKVYQNVDSIKIELNILNSLIYSKNVEQDFKNILERYPEVLKCIPILIAVRLNEIHILDNSINYTYNFKEKNHSIEEYANFMRKIGLFELLENHLINNLVDYVTGIEVGLDSNGRKNRGGHLMEDLVESYIIKAGFQRNTNYFKEMYIHEITKKWNIDLSAISNKGKTEKRFDFVIKTSNMIYGIETNFYSSGGSKLNETARSYKQIAQEVNTINGFTFLWFTDGVGWKTAKNNLEETFDIMEHIYCINDLKHDILTKIIV
jgi:type II restriction enzyme